MYDHDIEFPYRTLARNTWWIRNITFELDSGETAAAAEDSTTRVKNSFSSRFSPSQRDSYFGGVIPVHLGVLFDGIPSMKECRSLLRWFY